MARPALTREERKTIMQSLISSAEEIIRNEGVGKVTIRKVADLSNVNSAVLYQFFENRGELLVFASLDSLKEYYIRLDQQIHQQGKMKSDRAIYKISWSLFTDFSFNSPELAEILFFSPFSEKLTHHINVHMDLFPEVYEGLDGDVREMIKEGNLPERNLKILRPVLDGIASEEDIENINQLTVSYFYYLVTKDREDSPEEKKRKMLSALDFMINKYGT